MQPRAYIHHTTTTEAHLRRCYQQQGQPMKAIAKDLDIPANKLYELAKRQNIKKRKPKK